MWYYSVANTKSLAGLPEGFRSSIYLISGSVTLALAQLLAMSWLNAQGRTDYLVIKPRAINHVRVTYADQLGPSANVGLLLLTTIVGAFQGAYDVSFADEPTVAL